MGSLKVPYFTEQQLTETPKEFVDKLNQFALDLTKALSSTYQVEEQTLLLNTGDETTKFPWRVNNTTPRNVEVTYFESADGEDRVTSISGTPGWHYSNGTVFIDKIRGTFDLGYRYTIRFKVEV